MTDFLAQHWITLLGGGSITGFFGWIFYGRKNNNIEYAIKAQQVFEQLQDELKQDRDYYKEEYIKAREEHKLEVTYFRDKIDEVTKRADALQEQFNTISLSYSKEVEVSQNWERLYHELSKKYDDLSNKYDVVLKKLKTLEKNQNEKLQ